MHKILLTAATAFVLGLTPFATRADEVPTLATASDLLLPCQEADNDSRDGYPALLECTQFIRGFIAGYMLASDGGFALCLPEANQDDAIRRGFVRWVHGSFSARSKMPVGEALRQSLTEGFTCE